MSSSKRSPAPTRLRRSQSPSCSARYIDQRVPGVNPRADLLACAGDPNGRNRARKPEDHRDNACISVREDMSKLQEEVLLVVGACVRRDQPVGASDGPSQDCLPRRPRRDDAPRVKDHIDDLFQQLPQEKQSCYYRPTMPANVEDVTKKLMRDPLLILVKLTLEAIEENCITVEKEELKLCLCNMH